MIELKAPAETDGARGLFAVDVPNRPMLESVLAGRNPGWVFADQAEHPAAAVVVSLYRFTYVGGRWNRPLLDAAIAASHPTGQVLVIWGGDDLDRQPIPEGRGDVVERIEFTDHVPTWRADPPVPDGVELVAMTRELLEGCLWKPEIVADCGSVERFLEIGFGVCGVVRGRVVSEAYASIPGDQAYEIGPIVHPEYRRKGLAYATCAALIDECRRRGYDTVWSCDRHNQASTRLARRLGYRRERPYRFWAKRGGQ
jgi:GNAT superfamily N-acetyltransferase